MIKRTELLLLPDDEKRIEIAVKRIYPNVRFIDQLQWLDPAVPPARDSILECSEVAVIWNPDIVRELRGSKRVNGRIDGPQVGPVIQWLRSRLAQGRLEAGSWAASNDPKVEAEMVAFVKEVWKVMHRETSNKLTSGGSFGRKIVAGPPVRTFRVGPAALQAAARGDFELASNMSRLLP